MKYLVFSTAIFLLLLVCVKVYAATTTVHTTIQVSVCGNNTAEGGEDCDNSDLRGKSCTSLGYASGTLGCDISCSYDTTGCVAGSPTPTPTPNPSPTPLPTSGQATPTPTVIPQPTSTPVPQVAIQDTPTPQIPTNTPVPLPTTITAAQEAFPSTLQVFISENGTIAVEQLHSVLTLWVAGWKNFVQPGSTTNTKTSNAKTACDINHDGQCDLADLSVLLFHVTQ